MSRYTAYDDDYTEVQKALWDANVGRAVKGRRGQRILKLLADALDALPRHELAGGTFYEPTTGACCIWGAAALHTGKLPNSADLWSLNDEDLMETVDWAVHELGVTQTLAWELGWRNDDWYYRSDAERWEKLRATIGRWLGEENAT